MKHLIKIESTPNGVLGVRHAGLDQQYCEAGEQVILNWQPDAKWGLQEVHYTDDDGNITPVDLTPVKVDGMDVVVFTMPDDNITVGGTFKRFVLEDWTGDAAESPIFNGYIDATDQQRNTALANVSNQTANSTTGKMGYKVLDPTKTFVEQVTSENTIYEIRDVFDLGGSTINLPLNSTLKFNGGLLKNGRINGNNTTINADNVKVFDTNLICRGTYTNESASLNWFGCVTDSSFDSTSYLENAVNSTFICLEVLGVYYISRPIHATTKTYIGKSITNFMQCGFCASDNFEGKDYQITRDSTTYNLHTDGLFYYEFDQHPVFKDLFLDARKKAKYCLEHTAGYAWADLYKVYMINALVAGMLQYGCERPIYEDVSVKYCNVGIYVSETKINESDILDFSGTKIGSANLVHFRNCNCSECNYGFVFNNAYNTSMYSCSTGGDYLVGLYCNESYLVLDDFYTERDGMCNGYIDSNGDIVNGQNGLVPEYLINNNIDGFSSITKFAYSQSIVYYRASIVSYASEMIFSGLRASGYPRGTYETSSQQVQYPNIRTYSGTDSIIVGYSSNITINGSYSMYLGSNNSLSNGPLFAHFISCGISSANYRKSVFNIGNGTRGVKIYYGNITTTSPTSFLIPSIHIPSIYKGITYSDYIQNKIIDIRAVELVEYYKDIPLYRVKDVTSESSTHNNRWAVIPIANIPNIFGSDLQKCVRIIAKAEQNTGYLSIYARGEDNNGTNLGDLAKVFSNDITTAGYYDIWTSIDTQMMSSLGMTNMVFYIYLPKDVTKFLISDVLLYSVGEDFNRPIHIQPSLTYPVKGQQKFDDSLGKYVFYNGTSWVNFDGTALS